MLKQLSGKLRLIFIGSLALNGLVILWLLISTAATWYIGTTGVLDYAQIRAMHFEICEEKYQRMLDRIDQQFSYDLRRAADEKNSFAINMCLKNYKTGERLDIQPLVDQVK